MLRAVLDTNVLVSSLINLRGAPAQAVDGCLEGRWGLLASPEIMEEYEGVLRRPRLKLHPVSVAALITAIRRRAVTVIPRKPVRVCSDPDDDKFLCCALTGAASHLITGNLRDFPKNAYEGIRIVSPAEFLRLFP